MLSVFNEWTVNEYKYVLLHILIGDSMRAIGPAHPALKSIPLPLTSIHPSLIGRSSRKHACHLPSHHWAREVQGAWRWAWPASLLPASEGTTEGTVEIRQQHRLE